MIRRNHADSAGPRQKRYQLDFPNCDNCATHSELSVGQTNNVVTIKLMLRSWRMRDTFAFHLYPTWEQIPHLSMTRSLLPPKSAGGVTGRRYPWPS